MMVEITLRGVRDPELFIETRMPEIPRVGDRMLFQYPPRSNRGVRATVVAVQWYEFAGDKRWSIEVSVLEDV